MNAEESAYIAGIIDGEGTISIHRITVVSSYQGRHYQAFEYYIGLTMTDKEFMDTIKKIVNRGKGQVRNNPRSMLKGKAKPSFRIKWSGSRCLSLLKEIRPYLRLKTKHADIILELAQKQEEAQCQRSGSGNRYPDWFHNLVSDAEQKIRKLNTRGIDRVNYHSSPSPVKFKTGITVPSDSGIITSGPCSPTR